MTEKIPDLLEHIRQTVGCDYISDLAGVARQNPCAIIRALTMICPAAYPLAQWNDALDYVAGAPAQESEEAAYSLLQKLLSEFAAANDGTKAES